MAIEIKQYLKKSIHTLEIMKANVVVVKQNTNIILKCFIF